jgi:hypothetical protein
MISNTTRVTFEINALPGNELFTHEWDGMELDGLGGGSVATYECIEGAFGGSVGASLCGNYTFGADFFNDSDLDYASVPGIRTMGGDDSVVGPMQQGFDYFCDVVAGDVGTGETTVVCETSAWTANPGGAGIQLTFSNHTFGPSLIPDIAVDPTAVDYGDVVLGGSAQAIVTVTNDGDANLEIGLLGDTDGLAPPFSFGADNCSLQIMLPGDNCTVAVDFQPNLLGAHNDSFNIPSNDPDTPSMSVSLTGAGIETVGIGGSTSGIFVTSVTCKIQGKSAGPKKVEIPFGVNPWDCEAAGLVVEPGDVIQMHVEGIVE